MCSFVIDSCGNYFLKISNNNSGILTPHFPKINHALSNKAHIYSRHSIRHYLIGLCKHIFTESKLCSWDDKVPLRRVFIASLKIISPCLKPVVPRGSNPSHVEHQHTDYHNNLQKNQWVMFSKSKWKSEQGV